MTPYSLTDHYQHFEANCCLHFQGRTLRVQALVYPEGEGSSKMLVIILPDCMESHEKLKPHTEQFAFPEINKSHIYASFVILL
jgi:hypothetical protein